VHVLSQVDGMTLLTMTDTFMTNNTLWHFRTKNEDNEEEGSAVHLDFESATPVYLQHSSGGWLSQHVPEKKARQISSHFDDMRDVYAGAPSTLASTYVMTLAVCRGGYIHKRTFMHVNYILKLV
jgi:hypothetical protein